MKFSASHYKGVQFSAMQCIKSQYSLVHCSASNYNAVQCIAVQHIKMQYSAVQFCCHQTPILGSPLADLADLGGAEMSPAYPGIGSTRTGEYASFAAAAT